MRLPAFAALLLCLACPARAMEVGVSVTFPGYAMKRRVALPVDARPGDVVWESGPSDPVGADFKALLFQGVASRPGMNFSVSVQSQGVWGPWVATAGERFPSGRFWAKAEVSGAKGAAVRVRAFFNGRGEPGWLELYGLDASDLSEEGPEEGPFAGTGAFRRVSVSVAPLAAARPEISPREDWGALPAKKPYEPMLADRITVHHTESDQPMSRQAAIDELQATQGFHQHGRGWIDIAYHFLIDGTGRVWEGRPLAVVGAHVKGKNDGNIGISVMGDFHKPKNARPTAAQLDALAGLARWLCAAYRIPASRIVGHRDQQQTTCPGDLLYSKLPQIRQAADAPPPPLCASVVKTATVAARLRSFPVLQDPADAGAQAVQALFEDGLSRKSP